MVPAYIMPNCTVSLSLGKTHSSVLKIVAACILHLSFLLFTNPDFHILLSFNSSFDLFNTEQNVFEVSMFFLNFLRSLQISCINRLAHMSQTC